MEDSSTSNPALSAAGRSVGRIVGPLLLLVLVTPAAFETAALSSPILSILVVLVAAVGLLLIGACLASAITLLVAHFMGMDLPRQRLFHAWMLHFSIWALYTSLIWLALVILGFVLRLASGT